jgi:hypothetical protein
VKVLVDECVPAKLARLLANHGFTTEGHFAPIWASVVSPAIVIQSSLHMLFLLEQQW